MDEFSAAKKTFGFMKDSYEESSRKLLSDPNFLTGLKTFPRDNINDETIELLDPFMEV